ncbi:MAG: LysR family transcriptional regulator [Oscillospiraceae bacterium]|nr:LysR family transcriptional regulator [Oscillospiraceae bacterium]
MNFQQLKYYTVLCEAGSFSKAAESLFISQQGLSMAISNLEAEFSCKFFYRMPKGLVLTPDGEYFRDWATQMLGNLQELWEHFEGRDADQGIIKCAGAQGVISEFGSDLIEKFENIYKGYSVYIREYKDRLCDKVIEDEEAHIGFGIEPIDHSKFECHKIFELQLACLMHVGHPWTKYEKIPLSVLSEEQFFMVDEEFKTADSFIEVCSKHGVKIIPRMRVGEVTAVHRLVRSHGGVGLTNVAVAEALATPDTVWRPFDCDDMTWTIDLFKKRSVVLPRSSRAFFEYVQRLLSSDAREKIAPAHIMEQNITDKYEKIPNP